MAQGTCRLGRRTIYFSDHAFDRYWERHLDDDPHAGRKETREQLKDELSRARWERTPPSWARMSIWHAGRCEGVVMLDDDRCFIVNRNASRDLVAVTYLINQKEDTYARTA